MKPSLGVFAALCIAMIACAGCQPPGPPYSEALQNYTAEMQELQRLRTEREKIEQSVKAEVDPAALLNMSLDLAGRNADLLKPGADLLQQGGPLDQMLERTAQEMQLAKWQQERTKKGERLADPVAETAAINAERKRLGLPEVSGVAPEAAAHADLQKKTRERDKALAEIDKQIAAQQERVDRARELKDRLEARGR